MPTVLRNSSLLPRLPRMMSDIAFALVLLRMMSDIVFALLRLGLSGLLAGSGAEGTGRLLRASVASASSRLARSKREEAGFLEASLCGNSDSRSC